MIQELFNNLWELWYQGGQWYDYNGDGKGDSFSRFPTLFNLWVLCGCFLVSVAIAAAMDMDSDKIGITVFCGGFLGGVVIALAFPTMLIIMSAVGIAAGTYYAFWRLGKAWRKISKPVSFEEKLKELDELLKGQ